MSQAFTKTNTFESYCKEVNIILLKIYNEGFGLGSNVEDRQEFLTMFRETLPNKEIDYILVLADHRYARNHSDAINLVERLRKEGKSN